MIAARRLPLIVAIVLGALIVLAERPGSQAAGAVTHDYLFQMTGVPTGAGVALPGPFTEMDAMTVDSGRLWIAEHVNGTTNYRVEQFNASTGAFVSELEQPNPSLLYFDQGIAVGHSTGEAQLYLGADAYPEGNADGAVIAYNAAGQQQGVWNGADTPNGDFGCFECEGRGDIAVDGSAAIGDWAAGDVYVSAPVHRVVDVFKPTVGGGEEYVTQLTGASPSEPFQGPYGVAVSSVNGEVVVVDGEALDLFRPAPIVGQYEFVKRIAPPGKEAFAGVPAIAVDPGNGNIYASEGSAILEFDQAGNFVGRLTGVETPQGSFGTLASLAVDPANHRLYVADAHGEEGFIDAFGGDAVVPDVSTGGPTAVKPAGEGGIEATLNGTVNPVEAGEASCWFAWGTSSSFGQRAPCSSTVPDGASPVPVQAAVTLQPDTTYSYRLQARNANGTNYGEASEDQEFTTPGPGIHDESVSNVASTSATLEGKIDPNGATTTYYFEYGLDTKYGSYAPALPGVEVGSGHGDVAVDQHLQGLLAHTTYHYRVVATSQLSPGESQTFVGSDKTFVTQQSVSSSALPDGRAWEMVSPPNKQGAALESTPAEWGGLTQAAGDGNAVTYIANAPTEEQPQGNPSLERVQIFSWRSASGWMAKDISTPHERVVGLPLGNISEYKVFSTDLSLGLVEPTGGTPLSEEASEATPYLRHDASCESSPTTCYQPLVNPNDVPPGTKFGRGSESFFGNAGVEGATPDLSHVLLGSQVAMTATPGDKGGLYEWTDGKLTLVSVLPANEGGAPVYGSLGGNAGNTRNAVSDNGSRIFWSSFGSESHLYMTNTERKETIRLDTPESGVSGGSENPVFQTASANGEKAFFTDTARLTVDSNSRGADLYEFNAQTGKLTDLTVAENTNTGAELQGLVLGASEDGSYVYFVANGVLAPGAKRSDCTGETPVAGATCNLYVHHNGVTTLVAAISGEDHGGTFSSWLETMAARVSPNGRWLAFMSRASLTGFDNRDANSGVPDEEVFLYDAAGNKVTCVSCPPTGARPVGVYDEFKYPSLAADHLFAWQNRWVAAVVPSWIGTPKPVHQARDLSNSGRLFFDSNDSLVPTDTNGTWDVYEYQPGGVGDCSPASTTFSEGANGCVGLISSGGSSEESVFLDASENGDDVFFLTASQLAPQDYDHSLDVYDARVCTASSPCIAPPPVAPPACSTGDSCKPSPSPQPEGFGPPPTQTFAGVGNLTATGPSTALQPRGATRAHRLARALKACRKKGRRKRVLCERRARRLYGKTAGHARSAKRNSSSRSGR